MAVLMALLNLALILLSSLLFDGSQRSFEIDKKSGKAPLTVTLSAEDLYNAKLAKKFIWTFGDGQTLTTTSPNISHTFISSGNYITKLQYLKNTTDAVSKAISGGQVKIVVANPPNTLPVAKLNCSSSISKIIECNSVGSLDSDGTIISYLYEWGDGLSTTSGNANSISHQYSTGGLKSIKLTVTDNQGGKSSINLSVNVKANSAPVASIQCSVNNLLVICNALSSYDLEGGTLRYTFTYADGFSETNTNGLSTHAYASAGLYRTTVTVSDSEGLSATASVNVQAVLPPNILPIPQLNCNSTSPLSLVCDGLTSFDQDGHIVSFKYSFDDGAIIEKGTSEVVMHGFITPGNHSVTLNVIDNDGGVNQVTKTYTVKPNTLPIVQFKCDPNYLPKRIKCSSTSYDTDNQDRIVEYSWSIANNEAVKTIEPKFDTSVVAAGDYNIKLDVKDSFGGISTLTQKFTIVDTVAPVINFQYDTGKVFDSNVEQDFYVHVNDNEKIDFSSVSLFVNDTKVPSSKYSIDSNDNKIQVHFSLPSLMNLGPNKITVNVQDSSGNTSVASVIYKLSDSLAPEISVSPITGTHYTSQTGQIIFTLDNADDADWSTFSIKLDDFELDPTLYKIVGNKIILDISSGDLLAEDDNNFLISLADISGNIATKSAVYYLDISSLKFDFVPSSGTKFDLPSNTVSIYPIDASNSINWSSLKVYWNNTLLASNAYSLAEVENKILVSLDVALIGGTLRIEGLDASQRLISSEAKYYLKDTEAPVVSFSISEGSQFANNTTPDISFDIIDQSEIDYKTLKIILNNKELPISKYIVNSSSNRVTLKLDNIFKAQVGINNIEVNVNDTEGNLGGANLNFSVADTLPPLVTFSPVPGSSFHSNIVSLIANVVDDSLIDWSTLELSVNNIPTPLLNYYINSNTIFLNLNEDYSFELGANVVAISVDDIWGNKLISNVSYNLLEQRPIQLGFSPDRNTHLRKANPVLNTIFNFPANVQWETVTYKLNNTVLPINIINRINTNTISVALEGDYKLAQGLNTFTIEYKDSDGEINIESISYFLDDIYAPVIALNPSSGTISPTQDLNFSFNVIDVGGVNTNSLIVELNGKQVGNSYYAFKDLSSGAGQLKLSPGSNTLKLSVKDKKGNLGAAQSTYSFNYKVGPTFKFSPANWSEFKGGAEQTVVVEILDSVALNVALTKVRLNGSPVPASNLSWSSFQSKLSINFNNSIHFKAGTNTVVVSATDTAGNEASQSVNYKFSDILSPNISFLPLSGAEFTNLSNPEIKIKLEDLSGVDFNKLEIYLNDVKLNPVDYSINTLSNEVSLLLNSAKFFGGENRVQVKAYDIFSNIKIETATYNVLDTLPPSVSYYPTSGTRFNSSNQIIKVAFKDISEINWDSLSLKLNNQNIFVESISKNSNEVMISLGEDTKLKVGSNTISVSVSDLFGNSFNSSSQYFLEDNFATTFMFTPASGTVLPTVNNSIRIDLLDDSDIIASTVRLELNGVSIPSSMYSIWRNKSITLDLSNKLRMSQGLNRIGITVFDINGNVGNASASYFVDGVPESVLPSLTILPESGQLTSATKKIEIYVSDLSGVNYGKTKVLINGFQVPTSNLLINYDSDSVSVLLDENIKFNLGKNTLTALVTDNMNNINGKSVVYDLVTEIKNDVLPPVVTFNPAGGEFVSESPVITSFISDESGINYSTIKVSLNELDLDPSLVVIDQEKSKLTISLTENSFSKVSNSNVLTVSVKDLKGNLAIAQVGFDKKSESVYEVKNVSSIYPGGRSTCIILEGGAVRCWGSNNLGQLGIDNSGSQYTIGDNETPADIPTLAIPEPVKQVSQDGTTGCAVTVTGKLYCWGNSAYSNFGIPLTSTPTLMNIGMNISQVSLGSGAGCAILENGNLRCFGIGRRVNYAFNQNLALSDIPEIVFNSKVRQVSVGLDSTCALLNSGVVKCWGSNQYGQLGSGAGASLGYDANASTPNVPLPSKVVQISVGFESACALLDTGRVYCWGMNNDRSPGILGLGHTQNIGDNEAADSTTGVILPSAALRISVGIGHACAVLDTKELRCWGNSYYGETGDGTSSGSISMGTTRVGLVGNVADVMAGFYVTHAIMEDGTLKSFGYNGSAQLGLGNTNTYSVSPSLIPNTALGGKVQLSSNSSSENAIKSYFEVDRYYGPSPSLISFDASGSTPGGINNTITNYHWDFGDGTEIDTTSIILSHQFNVDGVFKVKLTIKNSVNETSVFQRTLTVGPVNNSPFAFFNSINSYGVAPFQTTFDASSSFDINGTIDSYVWDFGDNSSQTSNTPLVDHVYNHSGTFLVMMKVRDNAGAEADAFPLAITVREFNTNPFANIYCNRFGKKIECNAFGSGDLDGTIANYEWDYGDSFTAEGPDKFEISHSFLNDGNYNVHLVVTDNNGGKSSFEIPVVVDTVAPKILAGNYDNILTENIQFPLSLIIDDTNSVRTTILLNNQVAIVSNDHIIETYLTLAEGLNTISVISIDNAGNSTTKNISSSITLDTIAPVLASITPTDGASVSKQSILISGRFNERLSALTINDQPVTLGEDGKSFSYSFTAYSEGQQVLIFSASDTIGNTSSTSTSINVQLKILYPELISIQYLSDTQLKIIGAPGAIRAFSEITLSSGFFNNVSLTANANGSFEAILKYFTSAKIIVKDISSDRSETAQLSYNVDTTLAGTIKDTDGNPLPGVKITMKDTDIGSVVTNASGIFSFSNPPTGDRQLIIDAQSVPVEAVGPNKKFSVQQVSVSIGTRQANVLESPIYLAPLMYDGSETVIEDGVSTTVESEHVVNASIEIPGNIQVSFPEGNSLKAINMAEISKDKTTVPVLKEVEPQTVIALEPSGLSFSEPVQLTLPNTNEFPAGMQVMIYSKNSKTGNWEIDGVAKVDEDGEKIVTQDGMGITHFSEVYAAPMGLKYSQINSQDKAGADTFNGTVSTSISFPGYKSLGTDIAPKLLYKTNWSYPTATVTNIFDIPSEVQMISVEGKRILVPVKGDLGYIKTWVVPEKVDLDFIAGDYHSPKMSLTGIPYKAVVSLGMDFKDQKTGIIPFAANYEIYLKRMIIRTKIEAAGSMFDQKIRIVETPAESFPEIIPSELRGQLYIQNKSKSSAGRGWMIGGVQKIVNPGNARIMLEEEDGSVSTYVTNDRIQTIAKINEGFSGLSSLESNQVIISGNNNLIYQLDLDDKTKSTLLTAPTYTGYYNSSRTYGQTECSAWTKVIRKKICFAYTTRFYCEQKRSNYTLLPTRKYTIASPSGGGFIVASENGVINFDGEIAGRLKSPPTSDSDPLFCSSTASCSGQITTNNFATPGCPGTPAGSGKVYDQGYDEGPMNNARFNTIKSIASSRTSNGFAVADYGNHRVRFVNLDTKVVSTIAGNGKTDDSGDGGAAIDSSMYHPLGIVYDDNGNLYVSTENGYIRKIDSSGKITKIAGNPKGAFYDQANALDMYLSRPYGLALDQESNSLFVADSGNNRVLKINLTTGIAKTVAGNGYCQNETPSGETGGALNASLCNPEFITLDESKNLVIADTGHKLIRRVIFSDSASGDLKFNPIAEDGSNLIRNSDGTYIRNFRSGTKNYFDNLGKHVRSQDLAGRITINNYDSFGNIIEQVDPVGGRIFYEYGSFSNKLERIYYSVDNREFSFSYDLAGNLKDVTYPDGTVKGFEYDELGLLTKEIDQKGAITSYKYNNWKRLEEVTRSDGKKIIINDSQSSNMANNYTGGIKGSLKTQGLGSNQLIDGIVDAKGVTTSYVQDEFGYVATIIDGSGKITKVERDLRGRPLKVVNSDDNTTEYTYDFVTGDLLTKSDSLTGTTETYEYDIYGNLITTTDGAGKKTINLYNEKGLLVKAINEILGVSVSYTYNSLGLLTTQTNSLGQITSVVYDSRGNVISSKNADGKITNYNYYVSGFLKEVIDANDVKSSYEYNSMNKLTSVTSGERQRTEYNYQETGELIQIIDPNNKLTNFYYNDLGQIVKKVNNQGQINEYGYDENGNLTFEKIPNGQLKHFYYNNLNQLTRKLLPDDEYNFTYDTAGNVTSVQNLLSRIDLSYQHFDNNDVVTKAHSYGIGNGSDLPNTVITYNYNDLGDRVSMGTPKGTFQYFRDAAGRLRSIVNHKGETFTMKYDLAQRLKEITTPATITTFAFDQTGFNTQINHTRKSGANIEKFIYGKDEVGNQISKTTNEGTSTFSYDKNYQLIQAITPSLPVENFAYDSVGNRVSDRNSTYTYDQSNQEIKEDYKYLYIFDLNGNMLNKQEKGFTGNIQNYDYDSENQLRHFKLYKNGQLAKEVSYTYDALGRRIEKNIIDHEDSNASFLKRYSYDGSEILFELDNENNITQTYTHSTIRTDDPLALSNSDGSFYFIKDGLGSITDITNDEGFIIQHHAYTSYGVFLKVTNGAGVDLLTPKVDPYFTYTGREYDKETGLYYYRARYYDANIGRFLSADPYAGKISSPITHINKYSYVGNNPISLVDPSGMSSFSLGKAVGKFVSSAFGGPLLGALYTVFTDKVNNWVVDHKAELISASIIVAGSAIIIASGGTATPIVASILIGGAANSSSKGWNTKNFLVGAAGGIAGTAAIVGLSAAGAAGALYLGGGTAGAIAGATIGGALGGVVGANLNSQITQGRKASKGEMFVGGLLGGLGGLYSQASKGLASNLGSEVHEVQSSAVGGVPLNDTKDIGTGCVWAFGECSKSWK